MNHNLLELPRIETALKQAELEHLKAQTAAGVFSEEKEEE